MDAGTSLYRKQTVEKRSFQQPAYSLLVLGEELIQAREGLVSRAIGVALARRINCALLFYQARMLVVVTVQTQQFPVTAVGRIIVVIVIAVMDGQLVQVRAREFTRTTPADPRIHLERLLTIALVALVSVTSGFCDDLIEFFLVDIAR